MKILYLYPDLMNLYGRAGTFAPWSAAWRTRGRT